MLDSNSSPAVSVVVCTYNRPRSLRRALNSVLAQSLRDFEIIIIDDGSDAPVQFSANQINLIRIIRTVHRGIGAARAEALAVARGAFIAYCDDDDEWKPDHLHILLSFLTDNPNVDLVYSDSEWKHPTQPPTVPYSIDYEAALLAQGNYIFATDVLHRANAARDVGGFDPSLQAYEDWDLWLRMSRTHVLRHIPIVTASHFWHEKALLATAQWSDWDRIYQSHQTWLQAAGPAVQHDLLTPTGLRTGFDYSSWSSERRELIWHSIMRPNESFGGVARQLLPALERQGVQVTVAPTRNQAPAGFERFYQSPDHWGKFGFYLDYRSQPTVLNCERVITYSMWESTVVPDERVREINRGASLLYVPCQQNVESFREGGVSVPIRVLHLGVDPARFPYLDRQESDFFTFGTFGDLSARKGVDVLLRAFGDEFASHEPVRLVIKSNTPRHRYRTDDPRVHVFSGFLDHSELLKFLHRLDAFVLPSRGEGFGLCALEAMSTGLPVIATNWSGPSEYMRTEYSFPLSYRLVDANGTEARNRRHYGLWAEPDYEHLRHLMRSIFEDPHEAREKGRFAAHHVHERWTWDRIALQIRDDLDCMAQGEFRNAVSV